jgi:hypothetical protein
MKRTILIGLLCLVLVGCQPANPSESRRQTQITGADDFPAFVEIGSFNYSRVYRFVDDDYGVVCWYAYYPSTGASVFCIPLHDLEETP